MKKHFNKLTPAEAERLAMLAEEAAEVIQIVGKILRHGYESHHPDDGGIDNRGLLNKELLDFIAVSSAMVNYGDIDAIYARDATGRWAKKLRYTHHQEA